MLANFLGNRAANMKHKKELIRKINEQEAYYEKQSDDTLRRIIERYRAEDHSKDNKKKQEQLLVNVFSIVREASKRVFGLRHFDVQLLGGIFLHEGYISEMQTGEGKTLVATCPAVLNVVLGNKVHIVTVNDYLATRDFQKMGKLYAFLGLSTGLIISDLDKRRRWQSYACDITYATNNELGFDYLRDNMIGENDWKVQQGLDFVIIDEVDSVLIDEARTPLIISAPAEDNSLIYMQMADAVKDFKEGVDYTRDKENKKLLVGTDEGIRKVEAYFKIDNIYSIDNLILLNAFTQALKANFVFERDKDYVVQNGEIVIVDDFTGRLMNGRRYSDGLHQAIEAKEKVELKRESKTVATITFQNFFRLYKKLSGMTGTAKTDEKELYSTYSLPVIQIPKNHPPVRIDHPDVIFQTKRAKFKAVIEKVKECHAKKQPILVGTTSIASSEHISHLLTLENIPHTVLNAKHNEEEAEIISQAGRIGAVTIATNMAGRGTDIIPEEGVDELGGIFILGTEKHESRRIDNQLKGRTARQGAKGETQFYLSLEDDLFKYFGGDRLMRIFEKFNVNVDDTPIESAYLTRVINKSQMRVEGKNFEVRKHLLGYDDVLNKQRKVMYKQREEIKDGDYDYIMRNLNSFIESLAKKNILDAYADPAKYPEEWDLAGMVEAINKIAPDLVTFEEIDGLAKDELDELVIKRFQNLVLFKEKIFEVVKTDENGNEVVVNDGKAQLASILRTMLLDTVDKYWTSQINDMSALQEGINLRAYGQQNPLQEYKKDAFAMFEEMKAGIVENFVMFALTFKITFRTEEQPPAEEIKTDELPEEILEAKETQEDTDNEGIEPDEDVEKESEVGETADKADLEERPKDNIDDNDKVIEIHQEDEDKKLDVVA